MASQYPVCPICQYAHDPEGACVLGTREGGEPGVGSRLGPYYLQAMVGEGGMGRVFRAVHEKLGRPVAIKLMRRSVSFGDGVERFLREARVVNKARHDNLIEVTDIVEAPPGGDSYYVMEWLEGQNLHQRMVECNGLIPTPEYLRILIEVTRGLQAAHAAGLVHRDLKPENIFLADRVGGQARQRMVKVIDFGVALDTRERGSMLEDVIVGTPAYIAPEQAQGRSGDARSDIYSFGVILFELATGQLPFAASTATETVTMRLSGPPPRPRKVGGARVSRQLERIILRCMAEEPGQRYQDMGALRRDLERLLRDLLGPAWLAAARHALPYAAPVLALGLAGGLLWSLRAPIRGQAREIGERVSVLVRPPAAAPAEPAVEGPLPLQVEVRTAPSGAEVRYGGAVLGTTPCVVRLPEGEREIELRRSGYRREKKKIDVRVGARVSVKLVTR